MTTITTDTPRTSNEGSYSLEGVEAVGGRSRYAKPQNFEGRPARPAEAVAHAYAELAQQRIDQAEPIAPEPKSIPLRFVSRNQEGDVVSVPRGTVSRVPELETTRSGRFSKAKETGGALLDRLFLEPNVDVRDEAIFGALRELIEQEGITDGTTIRSLNDSVALLVCARAGVKINRWELPSPGASH